MAESPGDGEVVELTSVPTEAEATVIVAALEAEGIQAKITGELTSGFRAEAPGGVGVLVRREDLDRALQILPTTQQRPD